MNNISYNGPMRFENLPTTWLPDRILRVPNNSIFYFRFSSQKHSTAFSRRRVKLPERSDKLPLKTLLSSHLNSYRYFCFHQNQIGNLIGVASNVAWCISEILW